jgi:hypothetical protein
MDVRRKNMCHIRLSIEMREWRGLIRERAYALWVQEGWPKGHDVDNWLQAEAEIEAVRFENWPEHIGAPWVVGEALK